MTLGIAWLLAGCGSVDSPEGSSAYDCTPQIRMQGEVFDGWGYTDQPATRFAEADRADCHDVGPEARGSVFPDAPRQVAVWTFAGYSSEQVLGVRFGRDSFSVFIARSVPAAKAERIERELRTE